MKSILYKDIQYGVPFTTDEGGLFVKLSPDTSGISRTNQAIIIAQIPTSDGIPAWELTPFDANAIVYELEEGDSYEKA